MRIKNFRRLIPVSFQLPSYPADEYVIAFVNLEDRIVYVWDDDLQRYTPAGDDLEAMVLAEFNVAPLANMPQLPSGVISQASRVQQETMMGHEGIKERASQDEFRETN